MQPFCAAHLTTEQDTDRALAGALERVRAELDGRSADLVVCFVTPHHAAGLDALPARIAEALRTDALLGCTGESVLGDEREVEEGPALSLFAAHLPDTRVATFRAAFDGSLPQVPAVEGEPRDSSLLLLADPFSFPAQEWLDRIAEVAPGLPVIGGMASGGMGPGQNLIFDADGVAEGGALGAMISGAIELRPAVSQGCRPVGKPWVVTDTDEGHVLALGGRPALDVLMETMAGMEADERQAFQRAPFVGVAVDPTKSAFGRDDFLARLVQGADPNSKAVAVADHMRKGQTVQFLLRDADSAGEDIERVLSASSDADCAGALVFTCNGRGSRMFDAAHHDVGHVQRALGPDLPVSGFFALGEIGPVGPRAFLHGFTASTGLFVPRG